MGRKMSKSVKFLTQLVFKGALFVILLILCTTVMSKTLDIIIGGSMGEGLECLEDSDCPNGQFCHEEQYFCVACDVPPYEWTGTTCECPAGTVEKDGKTCVECLSDIHCVGDYVFCHTDLNICVKCHPPKLWQNNLCLCPNGTLEIDGACICDNPNEILNAAGVCVCSIDEKDCIKSMFNASECACCPLNTPVISGDKCVSCAQLDAGKPVWDANLKVCVQCLTDKDCKSDAPICNTNKKVCENCPPETPFWYEDLKKCAQCRTNADCSSDKPMCNENGMCEACPDEQYFDGEQCVTCQYEAEVYDKTRDKCVIELAASTFNRDFGRRRQSYGIVNPKIGPYPVAYALYATGNVDDYLHLDAYKGGKHYGGQTANGGPTRGRCLNPGREPMGRLIDRYVGTLPANTAGMVWVYSYTGWNTFSPAGGVAKLWLERSVTRK